MGDASSASPTSSCTRTPSTAEPDRSCPAPRRCSVRARLPAVPSCWSPCFWWTSRCRRTHKAAYSTHSTREGERSTKSKRESALRCLRYRPSCPSSSPLDSLNCSARTPEDRHSLRKFSHWKIVSGDVYSEGTPAHEHWLNIRKRKGMKQTLPAFGDYYDKV